MTPEQLAQQAASMEKSQAVADKNLIVIRSLAGKHPELQPQVGFTAKSFTVWPPRGEVDNPEINPITVKVDKKKGSTVSWLKHGGASRAWALATFLAGWIGDVDPLESENDVGGEASLHREGLYPI
ncbi:F5 [Symbiodinium sp. CCMP2456]|nr:F5 [Symbiodinium sp. CCMP2456]